METVTINILVTVFFYQNVREVAAEIQTQKNKSVNVDTFVRIVKEHLNFTELGFELINTFIEKIVIHERNKSEEKTKQQIEIHFNFGIGEVYLYEMDLKEIQEQSNDKNKSNSEPYEVRSLYA